MREGRDNMIRVVGVGKYGANLSDLFSHQSKQDARYRQNQIYSNNITSYLTF